MRKQLLMCKPTYFEVNYIINPWMSTHVNKTNQEKAQKQWDRLYAVLSQYAEISLLEPHPHVPDLVFTANAGLVNNNKCLLSRFHHPERQPEENINLAWFIKKGYGVQTISGNHFFEGEGDALYDFDKKRLWVGFGFRSDKAVLDQIQEFTALKEIIQLKLVNDNFYHLDTCFCPLADGFVMYYPEAFDQESITNIEKTIVKEKRITVSEQDAKQFCCNAVVITDKSKPHVIIMNNASKALQGRLEQLGYHVILTPVSEFMKAGGATKCLVLNLN